MLKYIYKTLLISLLSCTLMTLDFNSKGLTFNAGYAETVKTEGIKDSDMMATLTMTGVGLLTSRLYQCKLTTDMMLAAAGGAAFLAGEILSTLKLRKVMKDMETEITRDAKGNINQEQIESLKRLKKSYEEAKKTAGTKKMLQQAAAAAFLAAAASAGMLYMSQTAAEKACTGALASTAGVCAAEASAKAASYNYPGAAAASQGGAMATANGATQTAADAKETAPAPSNGQAATAKAADAAGTATRTTAASLCTGAKGASGICKSTILLKEGNRGVCMVPPTVGYDNIPSIYGTMKYVNYTPIHQPAGMVQIFQSLFVSNAHADLFTPLGIASSAAIAYLTMTSTTLGIKIDTYLFSPMNRAIIWGVLAGLAFAASSATSNVISKIEANIQKIDAILNNMNQMAAGATGTQIANNNAGVTTTLKPNAAIDFNANKYDAIDLEKDGNGALPCFTNAAPGKECKTLTDMNKDLPSFQNLDAESQKQLSSILNTANGFNGTSKISGDTLSGAAKLANSANALRAAANRANSKINDLLKAKGSKDTMESLSKSLSNDMEKAIRDGLKKSNSNPSSMMASIYGSNGGLGSSSTAVDDAEAKRLAAEEAARKKAAAEAAMGANVVDISAPTAAVDVGLGGSGSKEDKALGTDELANAAGTQGTIDQYDIKGDITKDSSSSIFELISNRYQHSAYPRLFKVKEPVSEAPVNK